MVAAAVLGATVRPAEAAVTSVSGSAFGYYVNVGLFGGPRNLKGAGTAVPTTDISYSPSVTLPPVGSATAVTASDLNGAKAQYGPAVIFGGLWPETVGTAPQSGPLTVSTQGTAGSGSVTSSATVELFPGCEGGLGSSCPAPGGFGPGPLIGENAVSTCTATESGVSGSSTFVNGHVETKYDAETQFPIPEFVVDIPDNPPPNWTISGTIDHVGDRFTIVINEQVIGPDSITVNAAHMYLLGEIARGDMVVGSSTCAVTSTVANSAPVANDDTYSTAPDTPLTVAAAGLLGNDTDANGDPLTATNSQAVFVPGPDEPTFSSGTTFTFPSDPANGTATIGADGSLTYTPDAGFAGTDTFTYVARDPRGAFDTGTVTVNVRPEADVSITLADTPDPATVRQPVTYTVNVTNGGPSDATGTSVFVKLTGAKFVSASGATCTVTKGKNGGIRCNLGTVAGVSGVTITLTASAPNKPGTATANGTVSTTSFDPDLSNNTASASTTVVR